MARKTTISTPSKPEEPAGRTYGYARVSSDSQAERGQSLEVQEQKLRAWALMQGRELTAMHIEAGVSGGVPFKDRPEGGKLWRTLQRGDAVVASKLDRAFRSALDCLQTVEQFRQRGVSLFLLDLGGGADDVSGNGIARVFLQIAGAFAEFERDRIGERIREGKRRQREKGEYSGGNMGFGMARDPHSGKVVLADIGKIRISKITRLRQSGMTLRQIAQTMRAAGVQISHEGVASVLKRAGVK
jgi:DNA invertase Pin-like site-specific DNA recombinase